MISRLIVVEVEEQFLAENRTADRAAELIELQRRQRLRGILKIAPCVERIVLEVLIERTMKLICATLRDLTEDGAANAILRGEIRIVDLDLGDGLEGVSLHVGAMWVRHRTAVGEKVAAIRLAAIERNRRAWIGDLIAVGRCACAARQKDGEVRPVLSDLRQLLHRLLVERRRLLAALGA